MRSTCDLASYLLLAEKILNAEKVRFQQYLTWSGIDVKLTTEFHTEILVRF